MDAYGPVWDDLLQKLWGDTSLSVKRTALEMQVGEGTIQRQARRLGLLFPKPGSYSVKPVVESVPDHSSPSAATIRDRYRITYLALVQEHGAKGSGFVHALIPKEHNWLNKHDRDWLKAHRPPKKPPVRLHKRKPNSVGRDWAVIDAELSAHVRVAADELRDLPGGRTDLYPIKLAHAHVMCK